MIELYKVNSANLPNQGILHTKKKCAAIILKFEQCDWTIKYDVFKQCQKSAKLCRPWSDCPFNLIWV